MDQNSYEIIMNCIQYGAPALASKLVPAFNDVVEQSNQMKAINRAKREEIEKAELAAAKAKAERSRARALNAAKARAAKAKAEAAEKDNVNE